MGVPGSRHGSVLTLDRRLVDGSSHACRTGVQRDATGDRSTAACTGPDRSSDCGSQYAGAGYQDFLRRHGMRCSMSRKANCWDNTVMERFFLNLKMERVWRKDYANHGEAIKDVTDFIMELYNQNRLHSTLGFLPPNQYARQMD